MRRSISGGFAALTAMTLVLSACNEDVVSPDKGAAISVVTPQDGSGTTVDDAGDGGDEDAGAEPAGDM